MIRIVFASMIAVALGVAAFAVQPAGQVAAGGCPADFVLGQPPEPIHPFDRNGDGQVCSWQLMRSGRVLLTVLIDNTIGDPGITPGPCTAPFRQVAIGDPGILPVRLGGVWRAIDGNGDGLACAWFDFARSILTVLDNPNALPR